MSLRLYLHVSLTMAKAAAPRGALVRLAHQLAKADFTHGGKLIRKPVVHKDGHVHNHWVLAHPGTAAQPTPHAEAFQIQSGPEYQRLQDALARPDVQAQLRSILSAPQDPPRFMGEDADDTAEVTNEDGSWNLPALWAQTDWDDLPSALGYLVAAEKLEYPSEIIFNKLNGNDLAEQALKETIAGFTFDDDEEGQEEKDLLERFAADVEPNWDVDVTDSINIVDGPESRDMLPVAWWAQRNDEDEDVVERIESYMRDLESEFKDTLERRLHEAFTKSGLGAEWRISNAPGGVEADPDVPRAEPRAYGPQRDLTPEDLMHVCGFPLGAEVTVELAGVNAHGLRVTMKAKHPGLGITAMHRSVHIEDVHAPARYVVNHLFTIDSAHQGGGTGTKVLLSQIKEMQALGFECIQTDPARNAHMNGYYTWAALGYDGAIPYDCRERVRDRFKARTGNDLPATVTTVQRLMRLPGGREVWKEAGTSFHAEFDTRADSPAVGFIEAYADKRGYTA